VSVQRLIVRSTFFAIIATMANLAAQRAVLSYESSGTGFVLAVLLGTVVGLAIKYVLDKRWIFYDLSSGLKSHSRRFTLYTLMGVLTTMIFCGTETAFWMIWQSDLMRELGAIMGLCVGYVVKFNLDRRYVFTDAQLGLKDVT
jgi:putative flippase GtrA